MFYVCVYRRFQDSGSWKLPEIYASFPWEIHSQPLVLRTLADPAIKCNSKQTVSPLYSILACPLWKIKDIFVSEGQSLFSHSFRTRPFSLWCLAFLVLLLSLCPFIYHITPWQWLTFTAREESPWGRPFSRQPLWCGDIISVLFSFICFVFWPSIFITCFHSCLAGFSILTRVTINSAPENFFFPFISLLFFFSPFKMCCFASGFHPVF